MHPDDQIEKHFNLKTAQKSGLKKLGIFTVRDLLYHFPARYHDTANAKKISELKTLEAGTPVIIYGKIKSIKTSKAWRKKIPMAEAVIEDDTDKIKIVWFRQPYVAKMLPKDSAVKIAGKITKTKSGVSIANPEFEIIAAMPADRESLFGDDKKTEMSFGVYPERRGVTSRWLYHAIQKVMKSGALDAFKDPIPQDIIKKYHLPSLKSALIWIHSPKKDTDAKAARKRFAFEEIFLIQLSRQLSRKEYEKNPSFAVAIKQTDVNDFTRRFGFNMTSAQKKAVDQILSDLQKDKPMSRLLEGDVGSGKTAVAAATAYATVMTRPNGNDFGNLQTAYMAPTEILAKQHFESFIEHFEHLPIKIGLITGSGCKKFPSKVGYEKSTNISRAQLLKWVANGETPILIGTHALIQKSVKFKNLAYVIVDEQHRFGTRQRAELIRKDLPAPGSARQAGKTVPHFLSMTATPIPRTLALTIYGDLDLTLLDEMPEGRKQIITEIVPPKKREEIYEKARAELSAGRQAYVICPRIDEPDPTKALALNVKSVKEEVALLKKHIFPEYEIETLHSKINPKEKEKIMNRFAVGEIDILVATSVVEVGVNVPNATVIIIEGAERFGLAQLHQLRGRVLRSNHQAHCFIFTDSKSQKTLERLNALKTAKNGFELAELDLALRGAGELSGAKQWGISDIGMEAIKNIKMVEAAREEARALLDRDSDLANHPLIKNRLQNASADIHFE